MLLERWSSFEVKEKDDMEMRATHEFQTGNNQLITNKIDFKIKETNIWKNVEIELLSKSAGGCPVHRLGEHLLFRTTGNMVRLYCKSCNDALVESIILPNDFLTIAYSQFSNSTIVSSVNEEYIIAFGASQPSVIDMHIHNDGIFVYNIEEKTMQKSKIKCPQSCESLYYHAVSMRNEQRDELMVFGFVNRCFASSEYQNIQRLPYYLVRLIAEWTSNEWIHLIDDDAKLHWKICLDELLDFEEQ